MQIDTRYQDSRCQSCEAKDCESCTQFVTRLLLTPPPGPFGKLIRRIRTAGGLVQYVFEDLPEP